VTIHKIVKKKKKKRGKQAKTKRNDSSKNKKWVSYHEYPLLKGTFFIKKEKQNGFSL
jgi:hypothetical protein